MDDYEKYERESKKIRKSNEHLLEEFEKSLKESGLAQKTIDNHVANIDFYINDYLLYEDAIEARDGVNSVSMFLGYWFIKKAMWASRTSIKKNAVSLKKFYAFLLEKGAIEKEQLEDLKATLKEGMPDWLATLDRFDNPLVDDVWQY